MVEIFDNVLEPEEIKILLDFYYKNDHLVDDRLDVRSKTPDWNSSDWPQQLVKKALDRVLADSYRVEVVLFYGSRISFRLHVDSGNGDDQPVYKNILIPLHVEGSATTVLFDNYWSGPHTRFGRVPLSPFAYSLPDRTGKLQTIDDVRNLLQQCQTCPESVEQFEITDKFIKTLKHIVAVRDNSGSKPPDSYVTDYKDIVNYQPNKKFNAMIHQQHLNHIPIENLHGLTVDQIVSWKVGQAVTFDRNQIHAAGSGHKFKIGISVFTYRA